MSSTRTSSPYFSPNSITAPDFFASSIGMICARVGVFFRISAFTSRSTLRISSSLIGLSWAKSKRVLSASTSEPFCCTCGPSTSRSALCMRCVTEWLRMVRSRRADVDARLDLVADLERAGLQRAVVAEDLGLDLLRVVDREGARRTDQLAAIADLAAGLGVERRLVEHHDARVARSSARRPARLRGRARPPCPAALSVS